MKHNQIGIKDIALHAGVSTGPVDKVLNNRGGVSLATRERILNSIKELGYTPNILASRLKSKKAYMIAVLIPEASAEIPFWLDHQRGFDDAIQELAPFGFQIDRYYFHQNSELSFLQQAAIVLEKNYDGIFMVPVFEDETVKFIKQLKPKNTPVVFFDTRIGTLPNIPFIGQNSTDSGYLAAELLHKCLPPSASVLIISLTREHDNHLQFSSRENGFRNFFKKKNAEILKYENNMDKETEINDELLSLLKKEPNIKGIFVTNGIHKVAPVFRKSKNQVLIGYDLIEENLKYLNKEIIDFLISQSPYTQAYTGLKLFYDLLILKKQVDKTYFLPINIIMKSNLKYCTDFQD
jgi:LacI family transcriptional regulator